MSIGDGNSWSIQFDSYETYYTLYDVLSMLYGLSGQAAADQSLPKFHHENLFDDYAALGATFTGGCGQDIWSVQHLATPQERLNQLGANPNMNISEFVCKYLYHV